MLGIFRKKKAAEPRAAEPASTQNTIDRELNKLSGGGLFGSTGSVSAESSLGISAVWACVRLISGTIASLPVNVYERTSAGREKAYTHPVHSVLRRPCGYQNKSEFFKILLLNMLLHGNGYARVYRDARFRPVSLEVLSPYNVLPRKVDNDVVYYVAGTDKPLNGFDVLHIKGVSTDGVTGKSPIRVHHENLELSNAAQGYGLNFFEKGGNTSSVFEMDGALGDEAYDRLKKQLGDRMTGLGNSHRPLLLENGMKYNRINIPLEDAQFIATRKFQKNEVATIFGVPPHMIADLERSTNNNIEHQTIEFATYCLQPYIVSLEEEINRKLFFDEEAARYYCSFNLNAIMRGDQAARANFYRTLFYIGAMCPNEIRELEDMNGYDGGDQYMVQSNMEKITNLDKSDGKSGDGNKVSKIGY